MEEYTIEELRDALQIISSTISGCEKFQMKFTKGSSQHTLLKNRIRALYISRSVITNEKAIDELTTEELMEALRPLSSIISKCEKAQSNFVEGTSQHIRLKKMIKAMDISISLMTDEIKKRG